MKFLAAACSSNPPKSHVEPVVESNNLILNLFGDDREVLSARVRAAAEAVGPNGHLILDYAPREKLQLPLTPGQGLPFPISSLLKDVSKEEQSRIYLTEFAEPYAWIRDSSIGFEKLPANRVRTVVKRDGNQSTPEHVGSFSAAAITTLLNSCADSSLDFPSLKKVALQEGMIVSNGAGLCVANAAVAGRIKASGYSSLAHDIGCDKLISSIDWQLWREQGHPNGHIDMSVAFLSPKVAVIPALDEKCKTSFKTGWPELKRQLEAENIEVIEIPVATGCIGNDAVVRTYSNMVVLKDAILVSRFLGDFAEDNARAVKILESAMAQGKISRRRIVQFPIGDEIKGGSIHCMTLNFPGRLAECSQEHLNEVLNRELSGYGDLANKISVSPKSSCAKGSDALATLKFFGSYFGDRSLTVAKKQPPIRLSAEMRSKALTISARLQQAMDSHCKL